MRLVALLLIATALLFGAKTSVDSQINKTSSQLNSYQKSQQDIHKKMEEIARAVSIQKNEINAQQVKLKQIQDELMVKELGYEQNSKDLAELKRVQAKLKQETEKIEEELVFSIAQNISLSLMLEHEFATNETSLIEYEALSLMLKDSKEQIKRLNERFYDNSKQIDSLRTQTTALQNAISTIDANRKDLVKIQDENKKSLSQLEDTKASYRRELKAILAKQDELKRTLSRLNIIKIDEIAKAQEEARRKEAFAVKTASAKDTPASTKPSGVTTNTKSIGNSYAEPKTRAYSGEKTIAPLDSYKITKRYGAYTDPIYGIRVFNESISMKPLGDSKVKTVFNGKVIYADQTAVLKSVVIVEHDNGLHTIYANLSQIAPDIQRGARIKKGAVIGRVGDELIFEATQQSLHIDPAKLF